MASHSLVIEGSYTVPFNPALGVTFGICGALLIQQVHFWTQMRINYRAGHYWVYNTYEGWSEQLRVYSAVAVRKTVKTLETSGVLIVGVFNKKAYDRTRWYRVDYETLTSHLAKTT